MKLNIKINQYTSYEVKLYVNNILVATLTKTKVIGRNIVSFDENSIRTNGMYGTSDTFTRNQITSDYTINLIDIKKSDNIKVEYLTYSNSFDNKGSFDLNIVICNLIDNALEALSLLGENDEKKIFISHHLLHTQYFKKDRKEPTR